jgi:hypothetical protein
MHRRNRRSEVTGTVGSWQCRVFSIADDEANTPRLLRKVAGLIESLGNPEILDVTYCLQTGGSDFESVMTVYYFLPEDR